MFAKTPPPPYLAVIFTNRLDTGNTDGYAETADAMETLAATMDGYLGIESVRQEDGTGITVSYWRDEEAIRAWKAATDHQVAQGRGRKDWYSAYQVRVARVERDYSFGSTD